MATTQTPGIHNSLSMRLLRVPVSMEPRRRIRQEQAPTIGRQSLRRAFTASTVNGNNARVDANLLSGLRSAKKERTRGRLAGLFDAEAGAPPSNQDRMNTDLRVREQQQEQRARPVALTSPDDPTLLSTTRTPARVEYDWWAWVAQLLTVCCSRSIISRWHPSHSEQQVQAWREKVASCIIIATLMTIMAFFTIGLQFAFCPSTASLIANSVLDQANHRALAYHSSIVIFGYTYDFNQTVPLLAKSGITVTTDYMSADLTQLFQADACTSYGVNLPCSAKARFGGSSLTAAPCLDPSILSSISPTGRAYFSWDDISVNNDAPNSLTVFNGAVLNLTTYRAVSPPPLFAEYPLVGSIVASNLGLDSTRAFAASYSTLSAGNCLAQRYIVGFVDRASVGCSATQFIQGAILVVIVFLMLIRFLMAFVFYWCMSGRIVFDRQNRNLQLMYKRRTQQSKLLASGPFATADGIGRQPTTGVNQTLSADDSFGANLHSALASNARRNVVLADDPYVVILVTCYTESRDSIQKTVESLARTDYPDSRKLLFVVCDGIVTGKGEDRPTPEYVLSLLTKDDDGEAVPVRQKYVAIADGDRTFNMATVHAGYYEHSGGGKVPMVVVVKCGSLDEANSQSKAGNRGKRDSQLVLMNLLASVFYENARMTPLDFELATKIQEINGGVNPSAYTLVLMVDADTAVYEHALYYMVQAMKNDERIMGLCGETRIENKSQNWVTKIQVFEYYISHQLGKAFESVFGGVTCLPGCFSMYRIKGAPLRNSRDPVSTGDANKMVPLLIDEEVMTYYKEHVLDTLHKQNLLALGEDRYLTTLMLSRCPKRRTIFVPQAMCETTVPDLFKDLLDQRRRWINSTIHNLLELLMVDNLCGVFCLSMRFVVLMELVGTVVLPVAVTLMFVLIITAFVLGASLPLFMLLATLLFPAILILMTTFELEYVGWMFIYLLALPIWNFVLPLNAFWQFDNFKWGQTRQVEGEPHGGTDHGARSGEFEAGSVPTKT
ncbi:chitin synthase-domain-containing protein [Chytriomyces sp. MP71]|nr:chitin synthase-domain-containing protein [Chytriomyces sp. MP71]KAI8610589.1 chitin synthase-domain-containing protein [Chytriomyces sp. MP71]